MSKYYNNNIYYNNKQSIIGKLIVNIIKIIVNFYFSRGVLLHFTNDIKFNY